VYDLTSRCPGRRPSSVPRYGERTTAKRARKAKAASVRVCAGWVVVVCGCCAVVQIQVGMMMESLAKSRLFAFSCVPHARRNLAALHSHIISSAPVTCFASSLRQPGNNSCGIFRRTLWPPLASGCANLPVFVTSSPVAFSQETRAEIFGLVRGPLPTSLPSL